MERKEDFHICGKSGITSWKMNYALSLFFYFFLRPGPGAYGVMDLVCSGSEQSILECQGTWDAEKTRDKTSDLAGVTCFTSGKKLSLLPGPCFQFSRYM